MLSAKPLQLPPIYEVLHGSVTGTNDQCLCACVSLLDRFIQTECFSLNPLQAHVDVCKKQNKTKTAFLRVIQRIVFRPNATSVDDGA